MNLNNLAKVVTLKEGKKIQVNIGQVKEIMKIVLQELAVLPEKDLAKVLKKYKTE